MGERNYIITPEETTKLIKYAWARNEKALTVLIMTLQKLSDDRRPTPPSENEK